MLIPLRPGELLRLIPAVATGPQFNACTGNPRKVLQRVLISVIGAVIALLISQTLLFSSQFGPVFLVVGFVFALFEGQIADLYTREIVEERREQANNDGRLELVENRRTWLTLELEDEEGYLGKVRFPFEKKHQQIRAGMVVRVLVLSERKDFAQVGAISDAWLPQLKLWVGEYPFLLRPAFEELCLKRFR
jgi:hypothetical protein